MAIVDNDVIMQSQLNQRMREVQQTIEKRGADAPPTDVLQQQVLERLITENLQLQIGERSGIRISDEELNRPWALSPSATTCRWSSSARRWPVTALARKPPASRSAARWSSAVCVSAASPSVSSVQPGGAELPRVGSRQAAAVREYHGQYPHRRAGRCRLGHHRAAERTAMDTYQQLQQGADFARLAVSRSGSENALEGGDMGWRKAAQLPPPFDTEVRELSVGEVTSRCVRRRASSCSLLDKRGGETQVRDEVHVRHILIKPSAIRSDEEARLLVQRLRDRINAGEDFAQLAVSFSEDPGSALNGGDLNWIDPASLVPEFREVMANTASGELSRYSSRPMVGTSSGARPPRHRCQRAVPRATGAEPAAQPQVR